MITLGITGNIGSGKSSVLNILKNMGIETYDLDNVAKDLYATDDKIKEQVLATFPSVLSDDNHIDTKKTFLRDIYDFENDIIYLKKIK